MLWSLIQDNISSLPICLSRRKGGVDMWLIIGMLLVICLFTIKVSRSFVILLLILVVIAVLGGPAIERNRQLDREMRSGHDIAR